MKKFIVHCSWFMVFCSSPLWFDNCSPLLAATYYCDPNGSDSAAGTSWGTAWASMHRAEPNWAGSGAKVAGGDIVYFKGGSYGAYVESLSSSRISYITYKAASGSVPVVPYIRVSLSGYNAYLRFDGFVVNADGSAPLGGSSLGSYRSYVYGRGSYFDFKNITIKGRGGYNVYKQTDIYETGFGFINASHVSIENCTVTNRADLDITKDYAFYWGFKTFGITDCNIINSVFERCFDNMFESGGSYILLRNCEFRYMNGDGLAIGANADHITIDGCSFHDCQKFVDFLDANTATYTNSNKTITAGTGTPYSSSWGGGVHKVRLTDSSGLFIPASGSNDYYWHPISSATTTTIVLSTALGKNYTLSKVEHTSTHGPDLLHTFDSSTHDKPINFLTIRNSRFYNTSAHGWFLDPDTGSHDWVLENNLLYCNTWWNPSNTTAIARVSGGKITHITFRNNTIVGDLWGGSDASAYDVFSGNIVRAINIGTVGHSFGSEDYNIWAKTSNNPNSMAGYTKGIHTLEVTDYNNYGAFKKLFKDYDTNDYTLTTFSRAVDSMPLADATTTDILGNARVDMPDVNHAPLADYADAGAYELQLADIPDPNNHNPVWVGVADQTVNENQTLTFTVIAHDEDEDPCTYSVLNLPTGATFNAMTRTFTWTPGYDISSAGNNAVFDLGFSVYDGTVSQVMTVKVTVLNTELYDIFRKQ